MLNIKGNQKLSQVVDSLCRCVGMAWMCLHRKIRPNVEDYNIKKVADHGLQAKNTHKVAI